MARISTNRKSGFILRGGSMRRETLWVGIPLVNTTLATGGNRALVRAGNAAFLALRPLTVIREHLHVSIQSDQVVATEDQQVAVGNCVVTDQAVAIGVTAVPNPAIDLGSDAWSLWAFLQASFLFHTASGSSPQFNTWKDIDSKAMRKVEEGFDFIEVVESEGTSDGLTISTVGRLLVKLH